MARRLKAPIGSTTEKTPEAQKRNGLLYRLDETKMKTESRVTPSIAKAIPEGSGFEVVFISQSARVLWPPGETSASESGQVHFGARGRNCPRMHHPGGATRIAKPIFPYDYL
jgi:hypothetical protein